MYKANFFNALSACSIAAFGQHGLGVIERADGMAGSIYGQFPPLANPGRGIGKWQTYDIIFRAPRFNEDGSVKEPARITALLNGILVQDNQELMGVATHKKRTSYKVHADKLPLTLQNHGQTVHYRNIWVRELEPRD